MFWREQVATEVAPTNWLGSTSGTVVGATSVATSMATAVFQQSRHEESASTDTKKEGGNGLTTAPARWVQGRLKKGPQGVT
jgi:hypothetical protein